jgi:hypothetical protein
MSCSWRCIALPFADSLPLLLAQTLQNDDIDDFIRKVDAVNDAISKMKVRHKHTHEDITPSLVNTYHTCCIAIYRRTGWDTGTRRRARGGRADSRRACCRGCKGECKTAPDISADCEQC